MLESSSCDKIAIQISRDPGSNFKSAAIVFLFHDCTLHEYLPNKKLSTAIGFQRITVTKINRNVLRVGLFTSDHVASFTERFQTQTLLMLKSLMFVHMRTFFLYSFFLEVVFVSSLYNLRHLTPCVESACLFSMHTCHLTHVRLNFVTKQYTHCTEKHIRCKECHLAIWL